MKASSNSWLIAFVCLALISSFVYGLRLAKRAFSAAPTYRSSEPIEYVKANGTVTAFNTITPKPAPSKAILPAAKWIPQTFNNCGPATTAMVLQYFGHTVDQETIKANLRTNSDDKNVFTYEMQEYLRSEYYIQSKLLYNGTSDKLKELIANGFYVVVEDWLHPGEDIGHVTIIRGYDDEQRVFIADDSYIGINITYPYDKFDAEQWKPFNREYVPVYKAEMEPLLQIIIGDDWDPTAMYEAAIKTAQTEIKQNSSDMYAWFNLGTSNYGLGKYVEAKEAFEQSRTLGWPKRMLWYQIQPIQTYNALGDYQKAIELADLGLAGNDSFAELHYEKAVAYKGLGNTIKAQEETKKALQYDPGIIVQ